MRFLEDGRRFIWETEKTGWKQYELRNLDGDLLATLTEDDHPVERSFGSTRRRRALVRLAEQRDPAQRPASSGGLDGEIVESPRPISIMVAS